MGAQDRGTWLELPFWRQVKYYLICIFIVGAFVWIPLVEIAERTNWYQLLLLSIVNFLMVHWYLPTTFAGILVVIGYFNFRSWKRKRLEVKERTKHSQQSQSQVSP